MKGAKTYGPVDAPEPITVSVRYDRANGGMDIDLSGSPQLHEAIGVLEMAKLMVMEEGR